MLVYESEDKREPPEDGLGANRKPKTRFTRKPQDNVSYVRHNAHGAGVAGGDGGGHQDIDPTGSRINRKLKIYHH